MIPAEITNIADQICAKHPDIPQAPYCQQLDYLYSCVCKANALTPSAIAEILDLEAFRILRHRDSIANVITNADSLFAEYSVLSFHMAMHHLNTGSTFSIAAALCSFTSALATSGYISNAESMTFKRELSETLLDFNYAAGKNDFSSFRMASAIRSKKSQNKQ